MSVDTKGLPEHAENMDDKELNLETINYIRVPLTEDDSKRIRRKTDRNILVILVWVYFLQILDKTVLGFGATFGLQKDTGLVGNQYSMVGSMQAIAMLVWLPFSSILVVKVPYRTLMPLLVLGWGTAQACMAACHSYSGLLATRFFLGLFEAGCLPLFSLITAQWYRRAEQPIRVAAWYSTNGLATIIAAALSYGLAHIKSSALKEWQILFLFVGLLTIVSAPIAYYVLDNDISHARFLTEHERLQGMERLRANQTGAGNQSFKWKHLIETVLDVKTYFWIALGMLLNIGASVTSIFGPQIIAGMGYDKFRGTLLNMPFGALQFVLILLASYLAQKARLKGAILAAFVLPVVAGLAILYSVPRTKASQHASMGGYYLLAFLYGGNPLIVSWIVGNTAGQTKKSVVMSLFQAALAAGNIVGPLMFNEKDKPRYLPGLRACLGIFVTLAVCIFLQWGLLIFMNKMQERRRVKNGKPAKLMDVSMRAHYHGVEEETEQADAENQIGSSAFSDLTDRENDEFVYIY